MFFVILEEVEDQYEIGDIIDLNDLGCLLEDVGDLRYKGFNTRKEAKAYVLTLDI